MGDVLEEIRAERLLEERCGSLAQELLRRAEGDREEVGRILVLMLPELIDKGFADVSRLPIRLKF